MSSKTRVTVTQDHSTPQKGQRTSEKTSLLLSEQNVGPSSSHTHDEVGKSRPSGTGGGALPTVLCFVLFPMVPVSFSVLAI